MFLIDPDEIRNALLSDWSDTHKEVYGFRPRWDVSAWSDDELYAEIEALRVEREIEIEAQTIPTCGDGWWYEGDPRALEG